jgi:CRISPR-associated protein Cas1
MLNEPGMFLGVKRGILVVHMKGEKVLEVPPPQLDQVMVTTRGASISSAALRLLALHGVDLIFYSGRGYPIARVVSIRSGAVKLRKAQYAMQETERGGELAKAFVLGKLSNQRSLLAHAARNRIRSNPKLAKELKALALEISEVVSQVRDMMVRPCEPMRKELMRLEAKGAESYWQGFSLLVPEFPGRKKKFDRPEDPINLSLNYGYGLLAGEVLMAVEKTGLDPYSGFLHSDSPRRPALVMDLMEEFRQPVVDRVVLRGMRDVKVEGGRLTRESRLLMAKAIAKRLSERLTFANRSLPISSHILLQARRVAEFVTRRPKGYTPFTER